MNNCKSVINDSNDGTLQLAVLWFWTMYTVWCSQQNALQKLDLFLYAQAKMVGRNQWIRPLKCSNLNQWIGPSDEITELFYCSNTTCDLRCDLAVMQIRQIRYCLIQNKYQCHRTTTHLQSRDAQILDVKFFFMVANICGSSENLLIHVTIPTTSVLEDKWTQLKCQNPILPRELHLLCHHECWGILLWIQIFTVHTQIFFLVIIFQKPFICVKCPAGMHASKIMKH